MIFFEDFCSRVRKLSKIINYDQLNNLIEFFESIVSKQPGPVSTNFHKSLDGTRILNYTQWENKKDWQNAIHDKEVLSHPKNPIKNVKVHVQDYEVAYTFNKNNDE